MKIKMDFTKRLIAIILLLSLAFSSLYCSEPYSSEAQSNLTSLEDIMTNLQNDYLNQQILVQDLQESLENVQSQLTNAEATVMSLEQSLQEISAQYEKQLKLSKKKDTLLSVLKWSLVCGIPIAITSGVIIGYKLKE